MVRWLDVAAAVLADPFRDRRFSPSRAVAALPGGHAPGDQVRHAQWLGQTSVDLKASEQTLGLMKGGRLLFSIDLG